MRVGKRFSADSSVDYSEFVLDWDNIWIADYGENQKADPKESFKLRYVLHQYM